MPLCFNRALFFIQRPILATRVFAQILMRVILISRVLTPLFLMLTLPLSMRTSAATTLTAANNKATLSPEPPLDADHCNAAIARNQYARLDATQLANTLANALGASASELEHPERARNTPFALPSDLALEFSRASTSLEYTEILTALAKYYISHNTCDLAQHSCHNAFLATNATLLLRRKLTREETHHWQQQFRINSHMALSAFLSQKEVRQIDFTQQPSLVNIATRMSLMLNDSTPDIVLLTKALDGHLAKRTVRTQEAERLINNHRNFYRAIKRFYSQWLGVYSSSSSNSNRHSNAAIESYNIAFAQTSQLFKPIFKGTFSDLLVNTHTISLTHAMAHDATVLEQVDRPGLFAKAGFLAANNNASIRGWKMRSALLCDVYYSPPDSHLNNDYQQIQAHHQQARNSAGFKLPRSLSIEHYLSTAHAQGHTYCNACHEQYLPLGRALNTFNAEGAAQAHFTLPDGSTRALRTAGRINIGENTPIAFNSAAHLLGQIAQTPQAQQCFVSQWLSFAAQLDNATHINRSSARCSTRAIYNRFSHNNGDLKQLLIDIASSDWLAQ